jgi:hypothetical protein
MHSTLQKAMEKVREFSRWTKQCRIKHAVHSFMQDVIGDAMLGAGVDCQVKVVQMMMQLTEKQ